MEPVRIAIVVPCFKVKEHILGVIAGIPEGVEKIYVIDDACPEQSGQHVQANCRDKRVEVIFNEANLGVGGAVVRGYRAAIDDNYEIVVKIDGDGQMDGSLIPAFVMPIVNGEADYTKGNRFYHPESLRTMPKTRLFANALMSFVTKLSSGYWNNFDPANGYTAISVAVLKRLPLDKLHPRYFFESDMMFRLNIIRAVLMDIPMDAVYAGERSNVKLASNIATFAAGHLRNFGKRILYNYYLRNFSLASLQLALGLPLVLFGAIYGICRWHISSTTMHNASAGTVMLSALPIIVGLQMLLSFLNYDINTVPRTPLSKSLN